MKYTDGEIDYYLSSRMNNFQRDLYIHLADWKRAQKDNQQGYYRGQKNDLIFADTMDEYFHIFQPARKTVQNLQFKKHKFFRHMASSQAACINLFVPLLQYPALAANIFRVIKPDLAAIATEEIENGYQLEFWGKNYISDPRGFLNDHNNASGTDADIAIAYRDQENELNLWLIEHKLSEPEFTTCAAASSEGRTVQHCCTPASDIYQNPSLCFYHSGKSYRYWEITKEANQLFTPALFASDIDCPFRKGLNQLWRNQLLAFAIEKSKTPFNKVFFSVVHHPGNLSLAESIREFKSLTNDTRKFFTFTSDVIHRAAQDLNAPELKKWVDWYREVYLWKDWLKNEN